MKNLEVLEQQAIDAAMKNKWRQAVESNKQILIFDEKNIDAYLRLGFAYLQDNKISTAKKIYKKAQELQPENSTAIKYLERIKVLESKKEKIEKSQKAMNPNLFLEIPGKTKVVSLVNLGQKSAIAKLRIGQEVRLVIKKRRVEIRTNEKEFVGCLPDDLSKRLLIFIKAQSEYYTYIKEVSFNKVVVFLHEEKKGKKMSRFTSFPVSLYSSMAEISEEEDKTDDKTEEINENDLEKLAEILTAEEKDYLPYRPEEEEEAEE